MIVSCEVGAGKESRHDPIAFRRANGVTRVVCVRALLARTRFDPATIEDEKLDLNGGAVALGHPLRVAGSYCARTH